MSLTGLCFSSTRGIVLSIFFCDPWFHSLGILFVVHYPLWQYLKWVIEGKLFPGLCRFWSLLPSHGNLGVQSWLLFPALTRFCPRLLFSLEILFPQKPNRLPIDFLLDSSSATNYSPNTFLDIVLNILSVFVPLSSCLPLLTGSHLDAIRLKGKATCDVACAKRWWWLSSPVLLTVFSLLFSTIWGLEVVYFKTPDLCNFPIFFHFLLQTAKTCQSLVAKMH